MVGGSAIQPPENGEKQMRRRSARVCLSGARVEGRGLGTAGEQRQEQEHQEHYAYFQSIGAQRP